MTTTPDPEVDGTPPQRGVPAWVVVFAFVLVVVSTVAALYFARQAADLSADAEILADGIDRSRLPREEAVAIAELARSQSDPVPHDEAHSHDHDESGHMAEMSPEDAARLEEQLAVARASVSRFDTLEKAEAAGYIKASGESDGAGAHWVKWSLVGEPFDIENPSMLLFDELVWGEEPELIAYSYWVGSEGEPEGFAGHEDAWHRHLGVCFINGWIKDENLLREECAGDWVNGTTMWMLHAWVVPGLENEYGVFHTVNPFLCERACGLED